MEAFFVSTSIVALAVLIAGVTLAYWVVARFEQPPEETRPMIKRILSLLTGDDEKQPDVLPITPLTDAGPLLTDHELPDSPPPSSGKN